MLKHPIALAVMACGLAVSAGIAPSYAEEKAAAFVENADYTKMSPEDLAEYLIFASDSFVLDQDTQEGGKSVERITQDELQKTCSALKGDRPNPDTAKAIVTAARATIQYPKDGIKLGDWKRGEALADSGFGYRLSDKSDDHSKGIVGGNCYACHEMSPKKIAFGTIGPSLKGFGKIRGNSEPIQQYVHDMLYNPHSVYPCTNMPRFGYNKLLTEQDISDLMAYLLDPTSPVNQ